MHSHSNVHDALAAALAPLAKPGSFSDPVMRGHVLHVAQAVATVRCALEASAHAVAIARLRALSVTSAELARVADRLPRGPLHGLMTNKVRASANWASSMLEYGWHGMAPTSQVAWGLGFDPGDFGTAAENPTLHWIACGTVPLYLTQSWQVLGGVIDAALLRGLGDLARSVCEQPDVRCAIFSGSSYRDTTHQLECMKHALLAMDLRMQECAWMLAQLSKRLDPLAGRVLSALDARYSGATGLPVEYIYSEFDQVQQRNMQQWWTAQLRLLHVRLLNDDGGLSAQGGDAVVDARRLLLGGMAALPTPDESCTA
ncbi:hypothetical protein NB699_001565 [Xanthomonas sacchari]|uniref:Uncharacterized protein n=1 Tax=Xanthomonas sacchari TaxID=56458 RepID=A0AA46SRY8_9XANT|nr:hypothetical protein [Xanthomonas sacchari]MCW0366582.1 hypothetical protein [Xanthomonas sacchari]MCW0440393.1 hypothetical protein [Xanthomonas sacchari]UYK87078.1 hypothetical protein NG824_11150 [Xanthomonas sacchari]